MASILTVPVALDPIPIVVAGPEEAVIVRLSLLPELIFAPIVYVSASRETSPSFEIVALDDRSLCPNGNRPCPRCAYISDGYVIIIIYIY